MKIRQETAYAQESYDIHSDTWGDICYYIRMGHEVDHDAYYDEVDADGDEILTLEEFMGDSHGMSESEAAFYAKHDEYVYNLISGIEGVEGLSPDEWHAALQCEYGVPKALL